MEHVSALLLGLGNGGVYAALALALVLTFRSSGVINFATGATALYAAYTYAGLRDGELIVLIPGLPTSVHLGTELALLPAVVLALALAGVLGALLYLVVFRPLRDSPPLARTVGSLGVLVVLQTQITNRVGSAPVSVAPIFPVHRWKVGSAAMLSDRFFLAVCVVALAVVLAAVNRWTRFGLLTRAVADSEPGAYVTGISPDRVALFNWMLSAAVAGMAGILIAPLSPLTPVTYTLFVVPALAAAVVGGFRSLVPTVAAGIGIGMVQSEALSMAPKHSWWPQTGSSELVPLVVILVVLLATGRAIPMRGMLVRHPLGRAPRARSLGLPIAIGSVIGLAALLLTAGSARAAVITSLVFGVISLSLVVVTGYAGQVSLAQLSLAGVAAFTLSGLTESWGIPFPLAPLLASLFAALIGVIVGLPALRLRGLTLGVVTLAFAYAIEAVWFRNTQIVHPGGGRVPSPKLFGFDLGVGSGLEFPRLQFGLLCLGTLVGVAVGVAKLRTSNLGSAMVAVRANERSAAGLGVDVVRVKLASFAIGSFIAGLGGSLLAYRRGSVSFESFTTIGNLTLLSTVYLAGVTSVFGGITAGVGVAGGLVFFAFQDLLDLGQWFAIVTGALLIVTLIRNPEGMAAPAHHLADRLALRRRLAADKAERTHQSEAGHHDETTHPAETRHQATNSRPERSGRAQEPILEIVGLDVRYGGVAAVSNVSLAVHSGTIVGLIGPNGAGKTSVIDAIAGFAPATGSIAVGGIVFDDLPPHRRVRVGLGRTFQSLELYDDLTVEENLGVAAARGATGRTNAAVDAALDLVGIGELKRTPAGSLSQGQRQLVSIARACASEPALLLLDEPAAGLDTNESKWLGERLRTIAASGVGILLVDHDVALVLSICDVVYVLDLGRVIAAGPAEVIRADRTVIDAYLGHTQPTGTHR